MKSSQLARCVAVVAMSTVSLATGCSGTADTSPFGTGSSGTSAGGATSTGATTGTVTGAGGANSTTAGTGSEATSSSGSAGTTSSSGAGGASDLGPGDLVITEIMNNPGSVSDDFGEWIEIHNVTGQAVDLAGLVLVSSGATHTIASSVKIAGGGYAVLGLNAMTATNGGVPVDYQYTQIKLMNTKGDLTLRTAGMVVLDTTTYDEASGLDPDGRSRSLDPSFLTAAMNDTDVHWCSGTTLFAGAMGDRGTPGKPNDACP
jgi:lamin tail-like protein